MVVKVYISNATIYTAAKKNQQQVLWLLSGLKIEHEVVDVGDSILEDEKEFLSEHGQPNKDGLVLTPQIFNDEELCGDYNAFQLALENEELFQFLRTDIPEKCPLQPLPASDEPEAAAPAPEEAAAEEAPAEEVAAEEAPAEEAAVEEATTEEASAEEVPAEEAPAEEAASEEAAAEEAPTEEAPAEEAPAEEAAAEEEA